MRPDPSPEYIAKSIERFKKFCRFDPGTGCVIWTGSTSMGRGKSAPYPHFWFNGEKWWGHRFAAKYIHGLDIEGLDVDHCCSDRTAAVSHPDTLCVEHLQALEPHRNRELQTRRMFIHLEVGLEDYEEIYRGYPEEPFTQIPYYPMPSWLKPAGDPDDDRTQPPF